MPPDQENKSWYSRIAWIALVPFMALAFGDALLAPTPAPSQPGFIDTVLASRAVVASIRIAIVFAALFVVLSVVALVAQRRWLTRVGPVEVSSLHAENQRLKEDLATSRHIIEDLKSKAAYSHQVIERGPSA